MNVCIAMLFGIFTLALLWIVLGCHGRCCDCIYYALCNDGHVLMTLVGYRSEESGFHTCVGYIGSLMVRWLGTGLYLIGIEYFHA